MHVTGAAERDALTQKTFSERTKARKKAKATPIFETHYKTRA